MRKMYIDNLPIKNNRVNWIDSKGVKCKFIYDDIKGEIEIIEYIKSKQKLMVSYNGELFNIKTSHFLKCNISYIIGKKTKEYKLSINSNIKDDYHDVDILEHIYIKYSNGKEKGYRCRCNKCGWDDWRISESNLIKGNGCPCCSNKVIVEGINNIGFTHPQISRYLKHDYDKIAYSINTNKKVDVLCPYCGFEKQMVITNLKRRGFSCPQCGDGVSMPQKFIFSMLNQLNVNFKEEFCPKWSNKKRYDFYFQQYNEKHIIEVHGLQHYKNGFESVGGGKLHEIQENDKLKRELALNNGIKDENYIVIDFRESTLEFGKKSILSSRLNEIFDLDMINWDKCLLDSLKSRVIEVINIRRNSNNTISVTEIMNITNLSRYTVCRYLHIGNELKMCKYNGIKDNGKHKNLYKPKPKKVKVYRGDTFINEYDSADEIANVSLDTFRIEFKANGIRAVCRGDRNSYRGYVFKYSN